MTDVLKTVTDRFCLYSIARKGRQNGRQYVLSAVKTMLESKETQEGLRLGELFGYYGHGRRQLTGKLEVPETSVIMVEGRPVVIDNVPLKIPKMKIEIDLYYLKDIVRQLYMLL